MPGATHKPSGGSSPDCSRPCRSHPPPGIRAAASALAFCLFIASCSYEEVEPDPGVASPGDYCAVDGTYACDDSETPSVAELVCVDNRFESSRSCAGGCQIVSALALVADSDSDSDSDASVEDSTAGGGGGGGGGGASSFVSQSGSNADTPHLVCVP